MGRHLIDTLTADRLLTGLMDPADAPPAYEGAARLFQAARGPAVPGELVRLDATVAAMGSVIRSAPPLVIPESPVVAPLERLSVLRQPKRLALVVLAASLATGLAIALVRGWLPSPAQFHRILPGGPGPTAEDRTTTPAIVAVAAPDAPSPRIGLPIPGGGPGRGSSPRNGEGDGSRHPTSPRQTHHRHHGTDTDTETTVGHGLCNAYFQGQGSAQGGKLDAKAFSRLKALADGQGESISDYCEQGTGSQSSTGPGRGGDRGKRGSGPTGRDRGAARSHHAARSTQSTHANSKE